MALTKISRGLLDTGVSDSSDATAITIDSSENVAIGSSTANKKFNIADSAQGGDALKLEFEAFSSSDKWAIYAYDRTNSHYANMSLGQNAIWINGADANIGIGTTSPVAPLTIDDKATVSFNVNDFALGHHLYYDAAGNDRWERLSSNAGSALYQTAGTMIFYRTSSGGSTGDAVTPSESMRIMSNGAVGIGFTGQISGATLSVYSSADGGVVIGSSSGSNAFRKIYHDPSSGILYFTSTGNAPYLSNAGGWTNASDVSIKKDIVDIDYGLSTVESLQPRRYKMKADDENK